MDRSDFRVIEGGMSDASDQEGPALLTRSQRKQAARTARYRRDPEYAERKRDIVRRSRFKKALAKIAQRGPVTIEDVLRLAMVEEDFARIALIPQLPATISHL